jgi:Sec-independent protein translocase protein TatA
MALDVLEWGVIAVMGAAILIWGPEKVPEIAKTLAKAKKEFDGATKQLQGITKELQTGLNSGNLNLDNISNAIIGTEAVTVDGNQGAAGVAAGPAGVAATPLPAAPKKSADEMLIEMAKSLSIQTQGKTREEVSKAIMDRVALPKATPAEPVQAVTPASAETQAQAAVEQTGAQAEAPAAASSPAAG